MGGIVLKYADHVGEVSEGVIDGDDMQFARLESSPGVQVPNTAECIYLRPLPPCLRMLAVAVQEDEAIELAGAESLCVCFNYNLPSSKGLDIQKATGFLHPVYLTNGWRAQHGALEVGRVVDWKCGVGEWQNLITD